MTRDEFLAYLRAQPLVVSVQGSPGSPVDNLTNLLPLAQASLDQGVRILRLEGSVGVAMIRQATGAVAIGLIKEDYPGSEVYITPTVTEVDALLATGCEVISLDATGRPRPHGEELADLIGRVHKGGALVMGDCDTVESALLAERSGADLIATTLAGYTSAHPSTSGPGLELLREVLSAVRLPVLGEGRYARRWQVEAALRMGASGVVVGGALNDPVKLTRGLLPRRWTGTNVGAVDIGGSWLRFAVFSPDWRLIAEKRISLPPDPSERIAWICRQLSESGVERVGISTGGIVNPISGEVWEAKHIIPNHVGTRFDESTLPCPALALNDGHCAAWGHACLPELAGKSVATLALGTGVGAGWVSEGQVHMGPSGEYPRINDLPLMDGKTVEEALGGLELGPNPGKEARSSAYEALARTAGLIREMWRPDAIVVCGSVGLSEWIRPKIEELGLLQSPLGPDAALHGAAALILFPPENASLSSRWGEGS